MWSPKLEGVPFGDISSLDPKITDKILLLALITALGDFYTGQFISPHLFQSYLGGSFGFGL